jgi:hypothetical protein
MLRNKMRREDSWRLRLRNDNHKLGPRLDCLSSFDGRIIIGFTRHSRAAALDTREWPKKFRETDPDYAYSASRSRSESEATSVLVWYGSQSQLDA